MTTLRHRKAQRLQESQLVVKLIRTLPVENPAHWNTRCMGQAALLKLKNSKKVGFRALFYYMK
ncbi:MAG: hypothetical protein ACOYBT_08185 [Polynucleobacter sp.]